MDMKCGHFIAGNGIAATIVVGFIPDFLIVMDHHTVPTMYRWLHSIYLGGVQNQGMYGMQDASTGNWVACADADNGFIPYDASGEYANIESPIPGMGKIPTIIRDVPYVMANASTPRSGTVIGTIVVPTNLKNSLCYECTAYTGVMVTEPTWPTSPGSTVVDDGVTTWTCRNLEVVRNGGKGFTMGATINTDGHIVHFVAFRYDRDLYLGDASDGDICII